MERRVRLGPVDQRAAREVPSPRSTCVGLLSAVQHPRSWARDATVFDLVRLRDRQHEIWARSVPGGEPKTAVVPVSMTMAAAAALEGRGGAKARLSAYRSDRR